MKLVKTTGGASEGAGVIEAILSWWNTFRTGSEEDTSSNLFKKCANLTEEGRRTFVDSMQRVGVSTTFAVKTAEIGPSTAAAAHQEQVSDNGTTNCAQAKNSVATPPEAKEQVVGSLSSLSPHPQQVASAQQVASGAAVKPMVGGSVSWYLALQRDLITVLGHVGVEDEDAAEIWLLAARYHVRPLSLPSTCCCL